MPGKRLRLLAVVVLIELCAALHTELFFVIEKVELSDARHDLPGDDPKSTGTNASPENTTLDAEKDALEQHKVF